MITLTIIMMGLELFYLIKAIELKMKKEAIVLVLCLIVCFAAIQFSINIGENHAEYVGFKRAETIAREGRFDFQKVGKWFVEPNIIMINEERTITGK